MIGAQEAISGAHPARCSPAASGETTRAILRQRTDPPLLQPTAGRNGAELARAEWTVYSGPTQPVAAPECASRQSDLNIPIDITCKYSNF
jgi:hypothetical protein